MGRTYAMYKCGFQAEDAEVRVKWWAVIKNDMETLEKFLVCVYCVLFCVILRVWYVLLG